MFLAYEPNATKRALLGIHLHAVDVHGMGGLNTHERCMDCH